MYHIVIARVLTVGLLVMLVGCSSLNINKPSQAQIIESTRTNITISSKLSHHASSVLLSAGHTQESCMMDFHHCLKDIEAGIFADGISKSRLALYAELYYAYAIFNKNQVACLSPRAPIDPYYANAPLSDDAKTQQQLAHHACIQAYVDALYQTINHSYAYMFFDVLNHNTNTHTIVHEDDIKSQDLYHLASNELITQIYEQQSKLFAIEDNTNSHNNPYGQIYLSRYRTNKHAINLYIDDDPYYLNNLTSNHQQVLSELISAYDTRMAKLDATSTRLGLGVGYVGVLFDRRTLSLKNTLNTHVTANQDDTQNRIHPMGHILLTGIVKPQGTTLDSVLNSTELDIHFFNPYQHDTVEIFGHHYPLSANFSAGYALWLGENQLNKVGLVNMLEKQTTILPELFMLEPYNPNKKVVIMVHGLASSPATWVNFTNKLLADPILRNHYQVWQVFYSTNLPMLENRYQIQKLITDTYRQTDPTGTNPASKNSVLIGHSMGGILSRMMVSDDDLSLRLAGLDSTISHIGSSQTLKKLLPPTHAKEFGQRLHLHALPQVDTAVFISAPFRGTDYAERWFTRLARRTIRLPLDLTQTVGSALINIGNDQDNPIGALYLQNGASQLSDRSAFIALTKDININHRVRYYTIMGNKNGDTNDPEQGDTVGKNISDGIVPYASSHLDGVVRESIITGGHSIHENPQTVRELRRILYEHLANNQQ